MLNSSLSERYVPAGMVHRSFGRNATAELMSVRTMPAVLVALIGIVCEFWIWPEADVAWLLSAARSVSAGAKLYSSDLIEINPPVIMQLGHAALWMGRHAGLDSISAWRCVVIALLALSLAASLPLLARLLDDRRAELYAPASILLAAVLACLPGANFGQREHLIVLALAPYVLAAALSAANRPVGPRMAAAVGAMLALAVALKPHYLLPVALVEAVVMASRRSLRASWRAEIIVALVAVLALASVVIVAYPGYLSFVVPLALRFYPEYGDFQVVPAYGAYLAGALGIAAATVALAVDAPAARMCATAGLGAFLAFIAQGKGWEYHFLPARSFLILSAGFGVLAIGHAAAQFWLGARLQYVLMQATTIVCAVVVLGIGSMAVRRATRINSSPRTREVAALRSMLEDLRPGVGPSSLAALTVELYPASPVAELMGANWASRFSCLWMIPAIEAREREGGTAAEPQNSGRQFLESAVLDDLVRRRPTFLLIEDSRSYVLDELVSAPAMQDALREYRRAGQLGALQVWVRGTPAVAGQLR